MNPNSISNAILFLRKELINCRFLYVDLWSIVHIAFGGMFGLIFEDWRKVFALLVCWEIFEYMTGNFIYPETVINVIWDLAFGMAGFAVVRWRRNE